MEVLMQLSPKQISSIQKGRKVRVSKKHMTGSGVSLIVRPETFNRINRSFALNKGIDLALDGEELQATMKGGKINFLNKAKRWTGFIGDTLNGIAQSEFIKPILQAGTQRAVAAVNPSSGGMDIFKQAVDVIRPNQMQSTPSSGYDTYRQTADVYRPSQLQNFNPSKYFSQVSSGQNVDYLAKAAMQAMQANSYRPFSAPSPPSQSIVGTVTDESEINPYHVYIPMRHTLPSIQGQGMYLEGRGYLHSRANIDAPKTPFPRGHPARLSDSSEPSFLQQLPRVYKDAARVGSGLHL